MQSIRRKVRITQQAIRAAVARVCSNCSLKEAAGFIEVGRFVREVKRIECLSGSQIVVISPPFSGRLQQRAGYFCLVQMGDKNSDYSARYFILDCENIRKLSVEALSPTVHAGLSIRQLCANPNTAVGAANAPLQDIAGTKLTPNLSNVDRPLLVLKARIASDDEQF